jgi:hypothetical protein
LRDFRVIAVAWYDKNKSTRWKKSISRFKNECYSEYR